MLNLEQALDSEILQARHLVLELAALLDRLDDAARRADVSRPDADPRVAALRRALDVLTTAGPPTRAETILRLYSDR